MSSNLQYLVLLGATIQLVGSCSYIQGTLAGTTKPNKVSWLLWSIAPLIATVAALADGVRWAVLPVFMSGFVPFLILISAVYSKKAYWKLEKFDYICGLFSILALILWGVTGRPVVAITFAILSDFFAAIPTIVKSWRYPETESVGTFIAGIFCGLTSFTALRTWGFTEIAYPIYIILIDSTFTFLIIRKKK